MRSAGVLRALLSIRQIVDREKLDAVIILLEPKGDDETDPDKVRVGLDMMSSVGNENTRLVLKAALEQAQEERSYPASLELGSRFRGGT